MKKTLRIILLCIIVISVLPSCTLGVPSWLVGEASFELDEEALSEIRTLIRTTNTDTAYLERGIGNVQEYFYIENNECLWYKENSLDTIEAYRSGKLYNYDCDTEKLTRKDYKFNSSEYESEIEKGYEILKNVLRFNSNCFAASAYRIAGDRNNTDVTLDFKNPELSSDSIMLDVKFVRLGFVYNSKEKTYSKPFINWQIKNASYSVSFDENNKDALNEMISGLFKM